MFTQRRPERDKDFVRRNEQIRIPRVLVVKDGVRLGVYPTFEALRMAREEGLDLVEISPNDRPPVCSIMDYGRYKYDQQKKQKERKAKLSVHKEKEVSFRYVIDEHDLQTKTNQIRSWLLDGNRVKITVKFKARENAHKDQGMALISKCLEWLSDVGNVEKEPTFEGNQIICRLIPKKK